MAIATEEEPADADEDAPARVRCPGRSICTDFQLTIHNSLLSVLLTA
jgi:hypothetical protein